MVTGYSREEMKKMMGGPLKIKNTTIATIEYKWGGNTYRIEPGAWLFIPNSESVEITQISIQTPSGDQYHTPPPHECVLPDSYSWDKAQPLWSCPTQGCPKIWRLEKYLTGGHGTTKSQVKYGWRDTEA
jgi:hypothetical protein